MYFSSIVVGALSVLLYISFGLGSKEPLAYDKKLDVSYRGYLTNGIEHFQDIKYALDTSGTRRFAPPVPYLPQRGSTVDATARGPACPQSPEGVPPAFSPETNLSEDCLSIHIARPAGLSSNSKLPVLVWLHGGGVVKGSAYDDHSDPDKLIQLSKDNDQPIVYAAINYRMGIFGFARSDSLKADKSMNVGMRDQVMAFEWIRDNIAAFGGDPERITVFGLSSGGTFISMHHMAYGGEKGVPFTQAFMMSGPPGTMMNTTTLATDYHTKNVAKRLDCKTDDSVNMIECLRDVPMEKLRDVSVSYMVENHPPLGLFTFLPSVDGDILPDRPSKLLHDGRFAKGVPSILAWTEEDGAMNVGPPHLVQTEDDMKAPLSKFATEITSAETEKLFSLYRAEDFEQDVLNYNARKMSEDPPVTVHFYRISRLLRDLLFTCSSIDFTYQMVRHTRVDGGNPEFSNVRHYALNQSILAPMLSMIGMPYVQVCHGSDQSLVFNGVVPEMPQIDASNLELAKQFSSSIINFAATGDPESASEASGIGFEEWPVAYDTVDEDDTFMASQVNLLVVGGPHGTTPVSLSRDSNQVETGPGDDLKQQVLANTPPFGSMLSPQAQEAKRVYEAQKLFERCAYINSIGDSLGN